MSAAPRVVTGALLVLALGAEARADLTIEEAYRAIPHRQTTFDPGRSSISSGEKQALDRLFALTDRAMAARVQSLGWLRSGGRRDRFAPSYDRIVRDIRDLEVPGRLTGVHAAVTAAVEDQLAYLEEWNDARSRGEEYRWNMGRGAPRHPRASAASARLHEAYGILVNLYPSEDPQNRQAFFDHLCALDFY